MLSGGWFDRGGLVSGWAGAAPVWLPAGDGFGLADRGGRDEAADLDAVVGEDPEPAPGLHTVEPVEQGAVPV